ncbi:MAG: hypothetical protein ACPGYF_05170 [Chitinophagales bacterium]
MKSPEVLQALETLHREIEKLEPAIRHVEMAEQVTQSVKQIPQKHLEFLKEIKSNDEKHKEELISLFATEIASLSNANKKLQKTSADLQEQVLLEQEALSKLIDSVQSFYNRVDKINFPERLDKLDVNVAGIMAAIQSVQSRLDALERNITDRLRDNQDYQKESLKTMQTAADATAKNQKILIYITWALIASIGVLSLILNG